MVKETLYRLWEIHDRFLNIQAKERDPQIKSCIDEVLLQIEGLSESIRMLEKVLTTEVKNETT